MASLAVVSSTLSSNSSATSCESNADNLDIASNTTAGPADESEDSNGDNAIIIQDGMDTDSETPSPKSLIADDDTGLADVEEDDDDPSNDEETTCSICLINRQGPCRKYWLKFERCMKEHSAEKERAKEVAGAKRVADEEKTKESASPEDEAEPTLEEQWEEFMDKSTNPGEDDEEEDDDDDEEEEDDEGSEDSDSDMDGSNTEQEELSLGERCDKFMIPWIGCIQEHRNVYSLISNAFYQKDYVDPLEDTVPDHRRNPFSKTDADIGERDGYIIKYIGVEVDLGNWREHVEADADDGRDGEFLDDEEQQQLPQLSHHPEERHLINAYAKFRLTDESGQPIEVAYIKDQKGRLLGFDSFTKRDGNGAGAGEDGLHENKETEHDGSTSEHVKIHDGECTFHIVPGETTSVSAYAIYRGVRKEGEDGESVREDVMYYTPDIPLPGIQSGKK